VLFSVTDDFDSYIIVSFVNATLVLSIGETVEEVTDTGFLGTAPTLSCSQLGDDALVQVRKCSNLSDGLLHDLAILRINLLVYEGVSWWYKAHPV
jgi:splicing factor 3B subunit 3